MRAEPLGTVGRVSGLAEVQEAFRSLPARYLGAHEDFDATYHLRLGDVGHTWEVRCTTHGARVGSGITGRKPDVVIGTDSETCWRCGAATSPGSRRSPGAASPPAATSTSRSASRACSASPTAARRCCASTTSASAATESRS